MKNEAPTVSFLLESCDLIFGKKKKGMMGVFIAFGGTVCIISVFSGVNGRSAVTLADAHVFFFHCYILYKWYNSSIIICTNSVQTHAQTQQGVPTQGRHDDLHPSVAAELHHLSSGFSCKLGDCIFFFFFFYTQVLEKCRSTAQYSVQQVLKEEEPPSISCLPPTPSSRQQRSATFPDL